MGIEHALANQINEYLGNHPEENKVIYKINEPINLGKLIENIDKEYYVQQLGNLIVAYVREK